MDLKARAERLKTDIPAVFLAMKHGKTPVPAKIAAAPAVVCALSPVDLIPDFIPVLGYLDDLLLLPALLALTVKLIPPDVMEECRARAETLWRGGKPKKWYYALPFVFIWLLILWRVICLLRR